MPCLTQFGYGVLQGFQRMPVSCNESTSCFAVFILNGGEVMVDEAHPPVQLRQPVKNVLVKAEKTHYRVA